MEVLHGSFPPRFPPRLQDGPSRCTGLAHLPRRLLEILAPWPARRVYRNRSRTWRGSRGVWLWIRIVLPARRRERMVLRGWWIVSADFRAGELPRQLQLRLHRIPPPDRNDALRGYGLHGRRTGPS